MADGLEQIQPASATLPLLLMLGEILVVVAVALYYESQWRVREGRRFNLAPDWLAWLGTGYKWLYIGVPVLALLAEAATAAAWVMADEWGWKWGADLAGSTCKGAPAWAAAGVAGGWPWTGFLLAPGVPIWLASAMWLAECLGRLDPSGGQTKFESQPAAPAQWWENAPRQTDNYRDAGNAAP